MKKTATIIIALVLVLAFALCVCTACDRNESNDNGRKDKTVNKEIDEAEARLLMIGDKGIGGVIGIISNSKAIKVDYKTNFDGVEASGCAMLTQDNGKEYEATDQSIIYSKETKNGIETEKYIGHNFFEQDGAIVKGETIYELSKVIKNGVEEKQVNILDNEEYNRSCANCLVFYISTLSSTVFAEYGEIIDTVVYSGTRTYKNGDLESTTIIATYEDAENEIKGEMTFVLSADEKQIEKAIVKQNGVVVYEATFIYNVNTIIMPFVNDDDTDWEERSSYETA